MEEKELDLIYRWEKIIAENWFLCKPPPGAVHKLFIQIYKK